MPTQTTPSNEVPSQDPHRILYQTYISHCNAHNFSAMEAFYTSPTININDSPWQRSAVTAQFKPLVEGFPDWHWDIRHFGVDGDFLYLHFKVSGTHLGTFQGIPPTGRRVETMQFTLYRIVEGKFADVWDLTDFEAIVKQIQ